MMSIWIGLHILAALAWVGGMFFAYVCLRPAAEVLEPPQRLAMWRGTFGRFFPLVWVAIVLLLLSGYAMVFLEFGGFAGAGLHVHLMQLSGLLMMALFAHVYFAPWRRLQAALDGGDVPTAAKQLGTIRQIVLINTILGVITVLLGASGRYWG